MQDISASENLFFLYYEAPLMRIQSTVGVRGV